MTAAAFQPENFVDLSTLSGDRRAVMTSVIPIARTRWRNAGPYDLSRSRSKLRGALSQGKASVIWPESQTCVGFEETSKRVFIPETGCGRCAAEICRQAGEPGQPGNARACEPRHMPAGRFSLISRTYSPRSVTSFSFLTIWRIPISEGGVMGAAIAAKAEIPRASTAERKTRVFISYSRKDSIFSNRLVDALNARGFEAYLDKKDILPG